jgi:hypothetical protein
VGKGNPGGQHQGRLRMSALGHKRTLGSVRVMSALPPKADIETQSRDVRFVPKADSCNRSKGIPFSHAVGRWDAVSRRDAVGRRTV